MRKIGIYLVISILVISLCPVYPITAYAEESEDDRQRSLIESKLFTLYETINLDAIDNTIEYEEVNVVLFADKSEEQIDFFEEIPQSGKEPTLVIPDETEAIQFTPKFDEDEELTDLEYGLIEYTSIVDEKETTILGYVHTDHIILAEDSELYKTTRNEQEASSKDKVKTEEEEISDEANGLNEPNTESDENKNTRKNNDSFDETNNKSIQSFSTSSTLKRGSNNAKVKQLKLDLDVLGFKVSNNPNNIFGPATEKMVKEFQQYYGLKETGIVNSSTNEKIDKFINGYYRNGKKHNNVITLKNNLNSLGFKVSNNPNENYGPATTKQVKEFQQFYSLKVNGIADDVTLNKINNLLNTPMKNGDYRKDAINFKEKINKLGFVVSKNPTPAYGPTTEKRVKEFQKYYNLKVTGTTNQETILKLDSILNTPFQNGKKHKDTINFKNNLEKLGFKISNKPNQSYGPTTTKKVKEFQKYYNLKVNGIGDPVTINKINNTLNSPLRINKSHKDVIKLKQNLASLGYGSFAYENQNYGPQTRDAVIKFQKSNNLAVSGIAEEVTLAKISTLVKQNNDNSSKPVNKTEYTNYNITLNKALDIQMARPTIITDKYQNKPAYVSARFLRLTGSAKVSGAKVNIRTAPNSKSQTSNIAFALVGGTPITITGATQGNKVSGSTLWYQISQNGKKYYIHSSLASGAQAVTTANVNVRAGQGANHHKYGLLKKGDKVRIIAQGPSWHEIEYKAWRNPTRSDMKAYLDPSKNDKFQHLRLDSTVGVSAGELNKVLTGKGVLAGQGQAFINGAKKHGINEAYLMSHAFLETGHGTSTLAKGVEVGKDKSGKPVRVTSSNRKNLTAIKTTYNMFGIGAVDSNPLNGGAITAYENGWTTPAKAIEGGAKWIGDGYIYNEHGQNTLYKMKWNPRMNEGYAWKQYATDIAWATKQVSQIKNIYNQLNNPSHHFDIARYN